MSSHRLHERCACAGLRGSFALPGTGRKYERSAPFAITHLALDLKLDFERQRVEGEARLDVTRRAAKARELRLDAVGFELGKIELLDGERWIAAPHRYDGDELCITLPAKLKVGRVRIRYSVAPRRGLYFNAPDAAVPDRPTQVWTQCQDEDARHWVPCHDHPHMKQSTELSVTVPNGYTALSNGELVSADRPRGRAPWRFHYRHAEPHSSYLLTLVVGHFDVVEEEPVKLGSARSVPVSYYVPKGRAADAKPTFGETPNMLRLFGEVTGVPYPWSRYSQVVVTNFIFGGMENTTSTTLYEHALLDQRARLDATSNDLIAHELAHQWFGDYVTCRDWSHGWLNEGFATFFEHVERAARLGRDEYDQGIANDLGAYLAEANGHYQRPIVCKDFAAPIDLFDRHLYEKGGLVLHLLRLRLGDDAFWGGVRRYLETHAHGVVETRDLQRALEAASGESLDRFFDEWLHRPGHPVCEVKLAWSDGKLEVSLRQKQKGSDVPHFELPLVVEVADAKGKLQRHRVEVQGERGALTVALKERPRFVVFDPDFEVIGDLTLEMPADFAHRQLAEGPSARARVQAAAALGKRHDAPSIAALAASLGKKKELWMVRAAAAEALGGIRGPDALKALSAAALDAHPKVRRAVVNALAHFRGEAAAADALLPLVKDEPSYLVQADACRALGNTRDERALTALRKVVDRKSWSDVLRAGALDGLGALGDEAALETVTERTRYGVPTRGRRAAILALPKIADSRAIRERLETLLDDADPHLRVDVIRALEALGDGKARAALRRRLGAESDGRVARRLKEALRDLSDGGAADKRRVNDELEGLRGKLRDLERRLAQLEPRREGRPAAARRVKKRAS